MCDTSVRQFFCIILLQNSIVILVPGDPETENSGSVVVDELLCVAIAVENLPFPTVHAVALFLVVLPASAHQIAASQFFQLDQTGTRPGSSVAVCMKG
mmetsp:Transcript_3384/g.12044  ORF Transcript_3384/g.12044 Transcript_3384/m.12044 type:complete len:98 (+) Transcript_3384:352-645(+)